MAPVSVHEEQVVAVPEHSMHKGSQPKHWFDVRKKLFGHGLKQVLLAKPYELLHETHAVAEAEVHDAHVAWHAVQLPPLRKYPFGHGL